MDKVVNKDTRKPENEELERLRFEMRDLTANIVRQVHRRMELSKKIGEIKTNLKMDVKDERVEQEIKSMVLELSDEIGMSKEFATQLIDILLTESKKLQQRHNSETHDLPANSEPKKQTHLSIFLKAKQLELSGKKIIHMEVGEPDFAAPSNIKETLVDSFNTGRYHYTEPAGVMKLRQAIANKLKRGITEDMVTVTVGGRFAVFATIVSLVKRGEEIISIEPAWPAYRDCADFIGAKTCVLRTSIEDAWVPDLDRLEEMITPNTKMIVINYPNNPTGKVLEKRMMQKLVSIAKDNSLYILSDEVYSDYVFGEFDSILDYDYDKGIMISSFSKSYAMTGFRVGYAVANRAILSKIVKVQATALTSVAEPMQYAALAACSSDPSDNVKVMKKRLDFITSRLNKMPVDFVSPDGAMYVFPRLRQQSLADGTVEKLLEMGVAVAPGGGFGDSYDNFIRISACQPQSILEKGLDIIGSVISVE